MPEVDLGVRWGEKPGHFIPTGAPSLDEALVNDPLSWMSGDALKTVRSPFEKGLRHYIESSKRPELLGDVVTDLYEALEATTKIVTGRDADLSGNRELFISRVRASAEYKLLLKQYIEYANRFRHAGDRPESSRAEAESFIYLTGLFIRLAIPTGG
jgi:hypothetical protein